MNRRMRTYFYAVLGAIGGLLAWQASNVLGLSFTGTFYLNVLIVGALVGLLIGLFIGITEGALTRNPVLALKAGLVGGLVGAAGRERRGWASSQQSQLGGIYPHLLEGAGSGGGFRSRPG